MPKIIWEDSFSVQHEEIDRQHKQWIEIFNTLHDNTMSGTKLEAAADSLEQIINYANFHFDYEEKLMADAAYPDLANHARVHRELRQRMYDYQRQREEGYPILNSQLLSEIRNWLLDHILKEDKGYSSYVSKLS